MFPTLHDTITGAERVCSDWDSSVFWWTEGNGVCAYNRAVAMELDPEESGITCSSLRFIAVAVHGDLEGMPMQEVLTAMNVRCCGG